MAPRRNTAFDGRELGAPRWSDLWLAPPATVHPIRSARRGHALADYMDRFVLGETMVLPLDTVTRKLAVLTRAGASKANPATILVEEMVADQSPVVILDPAGR